MPFPTTDSKNAGYSCSICGSHATRPDQHSDKCKYPYGFSKYQYIYNKCIF